jgi:hypothetical protein
VLSPFALVDSVMKMVVEYRFSSAFSFVDRFFFATFCSGKKG